MVCYGSLAATINEQFFIPSSMENAGTGNRKKILWPLLLPDNGFRLFRKSFPSSPQE
jgi:hypothetical protein